MVPSKPGDYSKEALVFDKLLTHVREEADGSGTEQTTARIRILADAGVKQMAVLQFTYTTDNQQIDIAYVRVIKPDGAVVVTPAYNVQDLPAEVTRSAPMYSDIHQKHVAVKGLGVGDTLEYQVTLTTLKPQVPGQFWWEYTFQKDLITLEQKVELDVPADKTVNVASKAGDPQPEITTTAGRKLYRWSSSNLARPDADAPAKSTKHWKPSIQVTTFSDWQQIGAWYAKLASSSLEVTPAVAAKAAALSKGLTSDEDRVGAIFNDVALHIHYVGLEFGIGRYQPHTADDVLSNEYGDCKDKHTLLAAELKSVGITAWPVLISNGRELDPATPSPAQFNHVITVVPLKDKLLWMDSTEEVAPVGVLMMTLRNKQALAVPSDKPAYLERTPAELPYAEANSFRAEGSLDKTGRLTAHVTQSAIGDVSLLLRLVFRQVPPSQLKPAVQAFANNENFGGEVSNPRISDPEQIAAPMQLDWDYTREKFGDWDESRIFPPLPPTGFSTMPGVKVDKPGDDIELGSPGVLDLVSEIRLPDGYSMVPPVGLTRSEDWGEYKSTYKFESGVYAAERKFTVKKTSIPLADWDKYLAMRRAIYADETGTSYLVKAIGAPGTASASMPASAAHLMASRMEMMQRVVAAIRPSKDAEEILESDPPADAASLKRAEELAQAGVDTIEAATSNLDAGELSSIFWMQALSYAWSERGLAALKAKDLDKAESYLRAAWLLSQDKRSGLWLSQLLEARGNKPGAEHQLELSYISTVDSGMGYMADAHEAIRAQIEHEYLNLTGQVIKATPLGTGNQYNGSLEAQLNKFNEVHPLVAKSHVNGAGYFILAIQAGNPSKAYVVDGDKAVGSMATALQAHAFPKSLPNGSKARLLREVYVICSQWAGCDADLQPPTSIKQTQTLTPIKAPPLRTSKPAR